MIKLDLDERAASLRSGCSIPPIPSGSVMKAADSPIVKPVLLASRGIDSQINEGAELVA